MNESLYDRFRPFKPYDLALTVIMLGLVAVNARTGWLQKSLLFAGGLALFAVLDYAQRHVRLPAPFWQMAAIVLVNALAITVVVNLHGNARFTLAFFMLNVAFATVAFGWQAGLFSSLVSLVADCLADFLTDQPSLPLLEWALLLAILLTLVAVLGRVNRLQEDAQFDAVTGLRNHRFFQVRIREEIKRGERSGLPTSLLLLDLDNFKQVNDRFGHAVGDKVLREVGETLASQARAGDVVCRYGGEEFAVILPETPLREGVHVGERLRAAVELRLAQQYAVTTSVGAGAYPENASQPDELIAAGDKALYRAKSEGKNRVVAAGAPRQESGTP